MNSILAEFRDWFGDMITNAKNTGAFAILGLLIMGIIYTMVWFVFGDPIHRFFSNIGFLNELAAIRREYFGFLPEIWDQHGAYRMEQSDFYVFWVLVILVLALCGVVGGACYTVKADPDQHADFVLSIKSIAMDTHAINGMGIFAVNAVSKDPVASVFVGALAMRNFLLPYVTAYATPYFFVLNLAYGALVLSVLGVVVFYSLGFMLPAFLESVFLVFKHGLGDYRQSLPSWSEAFVVSNTHFTEPMAYLNLVLTPLLVPVGLLAVLHGFVAGLRNSYWLGVGFALWAGSFFPDRWKARRAYRLRAEEMHLYCRSDGTPYPITADFSPHTRPTGPAEIEWIGADIAPDGTFIPATGPIDPR